MTRPTQTEAERWWQYSVSASAAGNRASNRYRHRCDCSYCLGTDKRLKQEVLRKRELEEFRREYNAG